MGYQGGRRYGGNDFGSDYDRNRERGSYGPRDAYYSRYDTGRRGPPRDYDPDERGFFDRAGDEVRSWFGDEEAERRREYDERMNRRYGDPREQSNRLGFAPRAGGYRPFTEQSDGQAPSAHGHSAYGPEADYGARDPHYSAWRNERISELDRDYQEYQRENRQRFDNEFGIWRTRRTQQRGYVGQVQEHMDVVGSDGVHVGTVDKTTGDRIILTRTDKDAGGVHHSIPSRWIDKIEGKTVTLEKTADEAHAAWRAERDQQALFKERSQYRGRPGEFDYGNNYRWMTE